MCEGHCGHGGGASCCCGHGGHGHQGCCRDHHGCCCGGHRTQHGGCCCGGHDGQQGCGCDRPFGFVRRFSTKEEEAAPLEQYLNDLEAEAKAVRERLVELKGS